MHTSVNRWFAHQRLPEGRTLEVGSLNVNGTIRPHFKGEYIGIDIRPGKDVDEVLDASNLVQRFGLRSFDIVVSAETLEHVRNWKRAVNQMKLVLKPGGKLYLTTRSEGFPRHDFPSDYWRFSVPLMKKVFGDFYSQVEEDPSEPGVFVRGAKPHNWQPADLSGLRAQKVIY